MRYPYSKRPLLTALLIIIVGQFLAIGWSLKNSPAYINVFISMPIGRTGSIYQSFSQIQFRSWKNGLDPTFLDNFLFTQYSLHRLAKFLELQLPKLKKYEISVHNFGLSEEYLVIRKKVSINDASEALEEEIASLITQANDQKDAFCQQVSDTTVVEEALVRKYFAELPLFVESCKKSFEVSQDAEKFLTAESDVPINRVGYFHGSSTVIVHLGFLIAAVFIQFLTMRGLSAYSVGRRENEKE